ncbi:hypothetical protein [Spiroplasma endosymbiont of Dioctria linearis]|uniref:hypothetical protein n=1 Tax=Spiroplasma endosymbiont of Dioctria linearis TaxID=3066290 RepID=UPI00313D7E3A
MEKKHLSEKNISIKENYDTNYVKYINYIIVICISIQALTLLLITTFYKINDVITIEILMALLTAIFLPLIAILFYLCCILLDRKSNLFYLKLKEIDWKEIYSLGNKESFKIDSITLNKFNISYYDLKQLIKRKIDDISILNSIIINLNDVSIKFIYEKIILNEDTNELSLIVCVNLNFNIKNKKEENNIFNSIKLKVEEEIVEAIPNKFLKLKLDLCLKERVLEVIKKDRFTKTYRTLKTTKNKTQEINDNILGLFYSVSHNKKNILEKYNEQIEKDIKRIELFIN